MMDVKRFFCSILFLALYLGLFCILLFFCFKIVIFIISLYTHCRIEMHLREILLFSFVVICFLFIFIDKKIHFSDKLMRILMRLFKIKNIFLVDYSQKVCLDAIERHGLYIDVVLKAEYSIVKKQIIAISIILIVPWIIFYIITRDLTHIYIMLGFMTIPALIAVFYLCIRNNSVKITNDRLEFYVRGNLKETIYWNELDGLYIRNHDAISFRINKNKCHEYFICYINKEKLETVRKFYCALLESLTRKS